VGHPERLEVRGADQDIGRAQDRDEIGAEAGEDHAALEVGIVLDGGQDRSLVPVAGRAVEHVVAHDQEARLRELRREAGRHAQEVEVALDRLEAPQDGDQRRVRGDAERCPRRVAVDRRVEAVDIHPQVAHLHPLRRHERRLPQEAGLAPARIGEEVSRLAEQAALPGAGMRPAAVDHPHPGHARPPAGRGDQRHTVILRADDSDPFAADQRLNRPHDRQARPQRRDEQRHRRPPGEDMHRPALRPPQRRELPLAGDEQVRRPAPGVQAAHHLVQAGLAAAQPGIAGDEQDRRGASHFRLGVIGWAGHLSSISLERGAYSTTSPAASACRRRPCGMIRVICGSR